MKSRNTHNRRGITLIEIGFVTAIAAVLMAMILGLAHHITGASNIRRAQTDLGAWHLAFDNWHETFGEYPGEIIEGGVRGETLFDNGDILSNLSNVYANCAVFFYQQNSMTGINFSSYCTLPVKIKDPWGTPYIYMRDESRQSYELFSCGPDAETEYINSGARAHNTNLDDIFFER